MLIGHYYVNVTSPKLRATEHVLDTTVRSTASTPDTGGKWSLEGCFPLDFVTLMTYLTVRATSHGCHFKGSGEALWSPSESQILWPVVPMARYARDTGHMMVPLGNNEQESDN